MASLVLNFDHSSQFFKSMKIKKVVISFDSIYGLSSVKVFHFFISNINF